MKSVISDNVTNELMGYTIAISGGSVLSCGHLFAQLQFNAGQRFVYYKGHCTVRAGENLTSTKYTYQPCANGEMILFIDISKTLTVFNVHTQWKRSMNGTEPFTGVNWVNVFFRKFQ